MNHQNCHLAQINNAGTASKPGIEDKDRLALDNLDFIYAVNFRRYQSTMAQTRFLFD